MSNIKNFPPQKEKKAVDMLDVETFLIEIKPIISLLNPSSGFISVDESRFLARSLQQIFEDFEKEFYCEESQEDPDDPENEHIAAE